jgi:hypothetical protein
VCTGNATTSAALESICPLSSVVRANVDNLVLAYAGSIVAHVTVITVLISIAGSAAVIAAILKH